MSLPVKRRMRRLMREAVATKTGCIPRGSQAVSKSQERQDRRKPEISTGHRNTTRPAAHGWRNGKTKAPRQPGEAGTGQPAEEMNMGWWILVVVVAGIAVWAVCAVRETRRVLDQEGNLLRDWEDVQ